MKTVHSGQENQVKFYEIAREQQLYYMYIIIASAYLNVTFLEH